MMITKAFKYAYELAAVSYTLKQENGFSNCKSSQNWKMHEFV